MNAPLASALRTGWILLATSLPLGITLEALHAFRVRGFLESPVRREMWRLAHAHGTLLALLLLAFVAVAERHLKEERHAAIARDLRIGAIAMPLGFFLGGILNGEGDPSLFVALVPVGALFLVVALVRATLATR
ncbi:MAG: hypothetical protein NTV21_17245 [Planctomycetota bacterium]|jgi:hypothetical protein|nr:hypothetical protein [Planctomycetota bacterium]